LTCAGGVTKGNTRKKAIAKSGDEGTSPLPGEEVWRRGRVMVKQPWQKKAQTWKWRSSTEKERPNDRERRKRRTASEDCARSEKKKKTPREEKKKKREEKTTKKKRKPTKKKNNPKRKGEGEDTGQESSMNTR